MTRMNANSSAHGAGCMRCRDPIPRFVCLALIVLSEFVIQESAAAQQPPEISPARATADQSTTPLQALRQRLQQLESGIAGGDLEEAQRSVLGTRLKECGTQLDAIAATQATIAEIQLGLDRLAETAQTFRQPPELDDTSPPERISVTKLEAELATLGVRIGQEEKQLEVLRQRLANISDEKQSMQQEVQTLETAQSKAADAVKSLAGTPSTVEQKTEKFALEVAELKAVADRDLALAQLAESDAQVALDFPSLRVSQQDALVSLLQNRQKALQQEMDARRQEQSRDELDNARQDERELGEIRSADVKELAEQRVDIAEENDRLTQQAIPRWQKNYEQRQNWLKRFREDGGKIQSRINRFGTDSTLGRELLHFRTILPSRRKLTERIAEVDALTAELRLKQLEYVQLADRLQVVREKLADSASDQDSAALKSFDTGLQLLRDSNRRLFTLLADVNGVDRDTLEFVETWSDYASEHALWLRSHEPLSRDELSTVLPMMSAATMELWQSLQRRSQKLGSTFWLISLPAMVALVLLFTVQRRARVSVLDYGEQAARKTCISTRPTMKTLLLSFGLAAEWPLLLVLVGSLLRINARGSSAGLGQALIQLGGIALWLNFFRQVLRPGGLASHHLFWNSVVCDRMRKWLHYVLMVVAGPMLLFLLARQLPTESDVPERLLFILVLMCSAAMLFRLTWPLTSDFCRTLIGDSGFFHAIRFVWPVLAVGIPGFLAACSITGYHHTATSIWDRIGWSIVAASMITLGWSLIVRFLRINHRATRLERAKERAQQRDRQDESSEASLPQPAATEDSELLVFGTQARELVRNAAILVMVGCAWGIWFDVLPALRGLDRHAVWSVEEQITVTSTNDDGTETTGLRTESRPVTVVSLLLAAFTGFAMWTGVRQLPGFLEVILIRQTSLDSGVRYTITTVVRYAILITGVFIVCHVVGLRWSQVQWLVAGLSVGLGFGLQEVFANFVSGIIILLERPIRVGDVVTIDGVSGVVSRIQIRATSITDWDRREYIVPNRELVTGKLLNWTLSDSTNRVVIAVGIGYGCDPDQARETMLEIARQHPNVLDDPGPIATFENFGDSSLDLVLRVYLPDLDNRLGTTTELHTQIHRTFAEAGIDIPFPQRDVHLPNGSTTAAVGQEAN